MIFLWLAGSEGGLEKNMENDPLLHSLLIRDNVRLIADCVPSVLEM